MINATQVLKAMFKPGKVYVFLTFVLLLAFVVGWGIIAVPEFREPYSPVLYDRSGFLLSARIASDGQWRFPMVDSVPDKFAKCLLTFEDQYFYWHPGVNPVSLLKALTKNIQAGKILSGGSTITMQLMRLGRKNKPRTYQEKFIETALALAAELKMSKREIFLRYASQAPFGGNVVGLEAASWRYFGRSSRDLSWAEAATLAVLPNAPSLVHANRNRVVLKLKRDRLLEKVLKRGYIDSLEFQLAISEELPNAPVVLPNEAPHYLEYLKSKASRWPIQSAIDRSLQRTADLVMKRHQASLSGNSIRHAAMIVRKVKTGEVLVYQGNSAVNPDDDGIYNDMIQTKRSSGSILKPFLFAASLDESKIVQTSLIEDVPVWIGGYSPRNFDEKYHGAISTAEALRRSLNVPFVLMLREYGQNKFLNLLREIGFSTLTFDADHYGLSLILGGGEVTLFELTAAYRKLALHVLADSVQFPVSQGAAWITTSVLQTLNRPQTESGWHYFGNELEMAWKTGTSYGFRDAWAIGYTPEYVIGVWVGNADGTGRPGLTGVSAAAPMLFDMAAMLPKNPMRFQPPDHQLKSLVICKASGFLAGPFCDEKDTCITTLEGAYTRVCPYHKPVQLDASEQYQLGADCNYSGKVVTKNFMSFPPQVAFYYARLHPDFQQIPPVFPGCSKTAAQQMAFLYPPPHAAVFVPVDFDGKINPMIAEVVHHEADATLYWHLDDRYLGMTKGDAHRFHIFPISGKHQLKVTDDTGNSLVTDFLVVSE